VASAFLFSLVMMCLLLPSAAFAQSGPAATQAILSTTLMVNQTATAFTPVIGSGGTGSLTYSISPPLPSGLIMSPSTGAIGGTPTVASVATTYTVMVTDANGATAAETFSLTVNGGVTISTTTLPAAPVGVPYSQTITATGGTGSYTFSITSGAPPSGLTLAANGVLSGTPTATGSFSFTVTATDGTNPNGSQAYTLSVDASLPRAPTIGTATAGNTQATVSFSGPATNGGSTITAYTVTSTPGNITGTGSASPITATGLTNGTAYTFTVTAPPPRPPIP
jgi:large repetitive protein